MINEGSPLLPEEYFLLRTCKQASAVKPLGKYVTGYLSRRYPSRKIKTSKAILRRTYRLANRLCKTGLLEPVNPTQKPVLYLTTPKGLDLLSSARFSNSVKKGPLALPRRARVERKEAILRTLDVKSLPLERREDIESYFEMYLEETTDLKIILGRKDFIARGPRANAFLVLPYSTRFNDEDKFKANLAKYHGIWNEATKKNRRAIHLVLTTDPKRFNNLWEANRHFSEAFNRFMSYLMKKLKLNTRPPYLAVYEYTAGSWLCKKCHTKLDKKFFCSKCKEVMPKEKRERFGGLLHCHLVIFGRAYLLPKRTITREWEKCGQGSYNFIYSLKNQKGAWVYAKGRPKEATKNETAESHLVKYLQKAKTDKGALYWVFNKRYFTNSKKLAGAPLNGWVIEPSIPEWKFLGAFHDWDLPDVVVENAFYLAGNGG